MFLATSPGLDRVHPRVPTKKDRLPRRHETSEPRPRANGDARRFRPSGEPRRPRTESLFRLAGLQTSSRSRFLVDPTGSMRLGSAYVRLPSIPAPGLRASAERVSWRWPPQRAARVPREKESTRIGGVVRNSFSFTSRSSTQHQRSAGGGLVQICVLNKERASPRQSARGNL